MSHQTYAPIRTSFWTDPKIRTSLPRDGKYLATYYFSAPPSNLVGLFNCPYDMVAKHTGLTLDEVRFHTQVTLTPYVTYDENTEEVFVHAAAKHRIGESIKPGDTRRRTCERLWKDCHSPYLKSAFSQRYVEWALDLPGVVVPPGYKHVVPPLPMPPGMPHPMPLSRSSSSSNAEHSTAEQKNTARGFEIAPEYTKGELLEAAKRECGLGLWDRQEESRANSVLVSWTGEGIKSERIWAAIHGARILANAGKVEWLPKGKPFGLRALRNTGTLYDQGDGKAARPFFEVAAEAYYADDSKGPRRRTTSPQPIEVVIPPPGGFRA